MDQWLDRPKAPRDGEGLDVEALGPYLRAHVPGAEGELVVEQFPSGFSNLTYLLRCGDLEMVLRRPPFGNRVKGAHDMGREFRVLDGLSKVYPLAPRPYAYCADDSVLGAPFYVMERRRGIILRRQLPKGLELPPVVASRLCESLVDNLARLHTLDVDAAGLGDLGVPEGYVERQIHGWVKRYQKAQTDSWRPFDEAGAWLVDTLPSITQGPGALVHNDYKFDNVLLDPNDLTRLVAVLDWEMCTLGDPLMDLGVSLAYWVEAGDPKPFQAAAFGPTMVPGSLTRRELADRYVSATGADLGNLTFYYVFGLYKLGVIVQQIYYRYFKGHTQDPRFAELNQLVGLLGQVAAGAIDRDRI